MATSIPTLDAEAIAYMDLSTSSHNCVRPKPYNQLLTLITHDGSASLIEPWHIIPILQIQVVPKLDFISHLPNTNTEFHSDFDVYEIAFQRYLAK